MTLDSADVYSSSVRMACLRSDVCPGLNGINGPRLDEEAWLWVGSRRLVTAAVRGVGGSLRSGIEGRLPRSKSW